MNQIPHFFSTDLQAQAQGQVTAMTLRIAGTKYYLQNQTVKSNLYFSDSLATPKSQVLCHARVLWMIMIRIISPAANRAPWRKSTTVLYLCPRLLRHPPQKNSGNIWKPVLAQIFDL